MSSRLIVGESGFIAQCLIRTYLENGVEFNSTTRNMTQKQSPFYLDLRDPHRFDYTQVNSTDYIFVLGAMSSPDFCIKHRDTAYLVNVRGTCQFIEGCLHRGARVLFFSSDTVYGKAQKIFDEDSPCFPIGEYGAMKHEVEMTFAGELNFKCFRLSYVFARHDKFTSYLNSCLRESREAEIFHPLVRNVVYVRDVIDAIEKLYQHWDAFGNQVFNICGTQSFSRKDLAELFQRIVSSKLKIRVVEPGPSFYEARPKVIHTVSKYLSPLLGRKPTALDEAMAMEFQV